MQKFYENNIWKFSSYHEQNIVCVLIKKLSCLILFTEIITVCLEKYTEFINTFFGQNQSYWVLVAGCIYELSLHFKLLMKLNPACLFMFTFAIFKHLICNHFSSFQSTFHIWSSSSGSWIAESFIISMSFLPSWNCFTHTITCVLIFPGQNLVGTFYKSLDFFLQLQKKFYHMCFWQTKHCMILYHVILWGLT
jgi:hypothetical protein